MNKDHSWIQHYRLTRRYFMRFGVIGAVAFKTLPLAALDDSRDRELQRAIDDLIPWLTGQDDFQDVSRGNPKPHTLSDQQREDVGLTRETWRLEVVSDP